MEALPLYIYAILWAAGFLSGFIDAIAGGGGLISLPALMACGIPPHLALGTNKLQGTFGSFAAAVNYCRHGLITTRETIPGIISTAIGAAIGTITIQILPADFLTYLIPILLVVIFFYTLCSPKFGEVETMARMPELTFYIIFGLMLGFYDGFFGPGTGSFWAVVFVLFMGYHLKKATAGTKIMNFTSNIVSLAAFIVGGNVLFMAGIIMGTGQFCGAAAGSGMMMRNGVKFIRVLFLTVVGLTILKLMASAFA